MIGYNTVDPIINMMNLIATEITIESIRKSDVILTKTIIGNEIEKTLSIFIFVSSHQVFKYNLYLI